MNTIEHNLPKSALALYVKIYIKKRGKIKDNKILIEATRSWLSLSELDKKQFLKKYNEYQNKVKLAHAYYLKNAVPYLEVKRKKTAIETQAINERTGSIQHHERPVNMDVDMEHNVQLDLPVNTESVTSIAGLTVIDYENNIQLPETPQSTNCFKDNDLPIEEPAPPKIISAEQLFRMVNENDGSNLTWGYLTKNQKRKYQNAVSQIKRKYLIEYKKYLEKLPSEKLYYHLKKKCE